MIYVDLEYSENLGYWCITVSRMGNFTLIQSTRGMPVFNNINHEPNWRWILPMAREMKASLDNIKFG